VTSVSRLLRENAFLLIALAVLGLGYLGLRSRPTAVASADELTTMISGRTTLLYFYSNT
jgi:hypothetical protein